MPPTNNGKGTAESGLEGVVRTDVAIAIIVRAGRVLICQRPEGGSFAGYWEFPGGKREPGESVEACLAREVLEELALLVTPTTALSTIDHDYLRGRIRLHPYVCTCAAGEPQLLACQAAKWIDPQALRAHQFPPANDSLITEVINHLNRNDAPGAPAGRQRLISTDQPPRLYATGD
jgi:mutator protein MutT